MISDLMNNGMHVFNPQPVNEGATILIVGLSRSGTSMVAGVLRQLGIFLGDAADRAVMEDKVLYGALETQEGKAASVISSYNQRHKVWAFKRPHAYEYIDGFLPLFRNPRFVVVFRDPLAIAKRNELSIKADFRKQLINSAQKQVQLCEFALRLKQPTMLVSYEKCMQKPEFFVDAVESFLNREFGESQKKLAAKGVQNAPRRYLLASQTRFKKSK